MEVKRNNKLLTLLKLSLYIDKKYHKKIRSLLKNGVSIDVIKERYLS